MKKIMLMGTLAAALAASQAHADILPLDTTVVTVTYNGTSNVLGLDTGFDSVAGSNVSKLDASDFGAEFITADNRFVLDFTSNGLLTVFANELTIPTGAYSLRFDFGATLPAALASFSLLDTSAIGGLPLLSVIDSHTLGLDLSNVTWSSSDFVSFTSQIGLAEPASVPTPGPLPLLLAGAGAMALVRRRSSGL